MPFQKKQMPLINPAKRFKLLFSNNMNLAFAQFIGKYNTTSIIKGD